MRKLCFVLCAFILCFNVVAKQVTFPVSSLRLDWNSSVEFTTEWDESWFTKSPFEYNHDLARIGIIFAHQAYINPNYIDTEKDWLMKSYDAIGMDKSLVEMHYDIDYSDAVFDINQVAFSFASKKVTGRDGKKKNLLFIVIRGTPPYAEEWASNIEIVDTDHKNFFVHEAFAKCREQVVSALMKYLIHNRIDPNETILFITGHSRGAGISNLLGAYFKEQKMFDENNMFVYTYACPNVVQQKEILPEDDYGYIWNVVNTEDMVMALPPYRGEWYFQKYGRVRAFINDWTDLDRNFHETDFVDINNTYKSLAQRDLCPFRSSAFVQSQISRFVSGTYKTLYKCYGSPFPGQTSNIIYKFYPRSNEAYQVYEQENIEDDIIIDVNENVAVEKNDDTAETKYSGGNIIYYVLNSLSDMHISEVYLSYLINLEEDEAFSTMGHIQILLDGFYECAVVDDSGKVVAKIFDGMVQFNSVSYPIAVSPLTIKGTTIGFPMNQDFKVVVYKDSWIATPISVTIEYYDYRGVLVKTSDKQFLKSNGNIGYTFNVSELYEDSVLHAKELRDKELYDVTKECGINSKNVFTMNPVVELNLNLSLGEGVKFGSRAIFASIMVHEQLHDFNSQLALSVGLGHEIDLIGNLFLDSEIIAKALCLTKESGEKAFSYIPELKFTLSFQPIHRYQIYTSAVFDFNICGFNDAAFETNVNYPVIPYMQFGDKLNVATTFAFGLRF